MSSTMHPEAMKAQAIAAYTYIMFNGGSVNNVILKPNPPQNVIDAVSAVAGQALYYDGSYALTVYGASSGGATASAADIWGRQYDYLVSVPSEYDAESLLWCGHLYVCGRSTLPYSECLWRFSFSKSVQLDPAGSRRQRLCPFGKHRRSENSKRRRIQKHSGTSQCQIRICLRIRNRCIKPA